MKRLYAAGRPPVSISGGWGHVCVVLDDSTVMCWRRYNWGELGYGDSLTRGNSAGTLPTSLPILSF